MEEAIGSTEYVGKSDAQFFNIIEFSFGHQMGILNNQLY